MPHQPQTDTDSSPLLSKELSWNQSGTVATTEWGQPDLEDLRTLMIKFGDVPLVGYRAYSGISL